MDRRDFLKKTGLAIAGGTLALSETAEASGHHRKTPHNPFGVLVDTTLCVGCRKCELACDRKNHLTKKPDKFFENTNVFNSKRPLTPESYTIVNRFPNPTNVLKPVYVKTQCMHCNDPACVSACIVGALRKQPRGPVTYDYDKCIGCRYCMVACPFSVPTYQYSEPLKPHVMKCSFCFDRLSKTGGTPACVDACPVSCLVFGRRKELLKMGRRWIEKSPNRYLNHIYGEHEAGGTSWMYAAGIPFETLGLPKIGGDAPPALSEGIQHSVFKHWIPPASLYMLLGGAMWLFRRKEENEAAETEKK